MAVRLVIDYTLSVMMMMMVVAVMVVLPIYNEANPDIQTLFRVNKKTSIGCFSAFSSPSLEEPKEGLSLNLPQNFMWKLLSMLSMAFATTSIQLQNFLICQV